MVRVLLAATVGLGLAAGVTQVAAQQGQIGATIQQPPIGIQAQAGRRAAFVCPAVTPAQIAGVDVWGTDVYLADSPICIAAVHAGALRAGQAGIVTIRVTAGADSFAGSARNGVTTQSYGPYGMAYVFDSSGPGQIDWSTTGLGIPAGFTATIPVSCPGGGAAAQTIYGTDVYTDDSSICTAAVHAGLITRLAGGAFFVSGAPGQDRYPSTDRNGVNSAYWGENPASFRVSSSSTPLIATASGVTGGAATTAVVGTVAAAPTSGLPPLADRTVNPGSTTIESCTKITNLKVVALGPTQTHATWDPMSTTCVKLLSAGGMDPWPVYFALHWPTGNTAGCPNDYKDAPANMGTGVYSYLGAPFSACAAVATQANAFNTSFDDIYTFVEGGSYNYRIWPFFLAYCQQGESGCSFGTKLVAFPFTDTSVTLPLSNKISRLDRAVMPAAPGTPPAAPTDFWGYRRDIVMRETTLNVRLGWKGSEGAASYRITRVRNTGDPETVIAEMPTLEFSPCLVYGCDPEQAASFYGWASNDYCRLRENCQFDDHDVAVGVMYSYRVWAISPDQQVSAPSSVVNVTVTSAAP